MSVNRCRHTFTEKTSLAPWQRCNLCLENILPLSECRYCANCSCYLHLRCYSNILEKIELIAEEMGSSAAARKDGKPLCANISVVDRELKIDVVERSDTPVNDHPNNNNNKSKETTPGKFDAAEEESEDDTMRPPVNAFEKWTSDFSSYMTVQRDALLKNISQTIETGVDNSLSLWASSPTQKTPTEKVEVIQKGDIPCEVHELEFRQFFMPVWCGHCYSALTAEQKTAVESRLLAGEVPNHDETTVTQLKRVTNALLAFGKDGYACTKCNLTLHLPCVVCLPPPPTGGLPYTIRCPTAHPVETKIKQDTSSSTESSEEFLTSLRVLFAETETATPKQKAAAQKESWVLSKAKELVTSYFNGSAAQSDVGMKVIVASLLQMMDKLVERHPGLLSASSFSFRRLRQVSLNQERLYLSSCESLEDANILRTDWDDLPTGPEGSMLFSLRDIVRYTIAVYGQSSLKPVKSGTVVTDEENNSAVTEVLALPRSALRASRWAKRSNEPTYALLVDTLSSRIVVTFRGTANDTDVLTDACSLALPFCGGRAHQGVALSANYIFEHRASTLRDRATESSAAHSRRHPEAPIVLPDEEAPLEPDYLLDTLQSVAEAYPNYDIVITGHSLGGGVAVLFGVRLQHDAVFPIEIHKRIRVIAYAAMPTLTLPAAEGFDDKNRLDENGRPFIRIWNLASGCDFIPRLQMNSIDRLCGMLCEAGQTEVEMTEVKVLPERSDTTASIEIVLNEEEEEVGLDEVGDEETEGKVSKPKKKKHQEDFSSELHHPGRVFLLTHPWNTNLNRLVEVPRGHVIMHEILLMKYMCELHLIDNYCKALQTVYTRAEVEKYLAK